MEVLSISKPELFSSDVVIHFRITFLSLIEKLNESNSIGNGASLELATQYEKFVVLTTIYLGLLTLTSALSPVGCQSIPLSLPHTSA